MLRPQTASAHRFAALALLFLAACDGSSAGEQQLFEDEALLTPVQGITETDAQATVTARDPSDWRIGPAYLNEASLLQLPSPNPVRFGDAIGFLVDLAQGLPGGLRLYVLAEDPVTRAVDLIPIADPNAYQPQATQTGFYSFSISARQIAYGGAGLYRVVLLDGRQGIVTYGDIEVRN